MLIVIIALVLLVALVAADAQPRAKLARIAFLGLPPANLATTSWLFVAFGDTDVVKAICPNTKNPIEIYH
jgi:hypothetical protein